MKTAVFTFEQVCELYSVLPHELDDASWALLKEDFEKMCQTVTGHWPRVYNLPEGLE
jgi:hypothetical protein